MAPGLTDIKWTQNSSVNLPVPGVLRKSKIQKHHAIKNLIVYGLTEVRFLIFVKSLQQREPQSYFGSTLGTLNQVPSPKVGNFVGYKIPLELSFIEIPFGSIIIDA